MITMKQISDLYDYHYWARDRQLVACGVLTENDLIRPMGNGFESIRERLLHLWRIEWIWLQRFSGRSPVKLPDWPLEGAAWNLNTLIRLWREVELGMRMYLGTITAGALVGPFVYVKATGMRAQDPLWRVLIALVNNQTHHRGQITIMLRQLGEMPPPIDFLSYLDSMGSQDRAGASVSFAASGM
jgi:uncharacterized damage-inducible protein DinB